jgi:hypothetical protein
MSDFIGSGDIRVAQGFKSGQLSLTDEVQGLADAAGVGEDDVARAHVAILTFSGADLRYRFDGTDPATDAGLVRKESAGELVVSGMANVRKLRLCRSGDTGTVLVDFQLGRVR